MRLISVMLFLLVPLWGTQMVGSLDAPAATLQGIDVSHHQSEIDWARVTQRHDLHFAFVKATEGGDFEDTLFCSNWSALREIGVRRGAYHFFRPGTCGYEQALHFLKTVVLEPGDLAPVLDLEVTEGVQTTDMLEEARVWLQTVERSLNIRPIIYTNQNFYEKYLSGVFDNYPLWIARYSDEAPLLSGAAVWNFWQYSDEGQVDGIGREVDLNVFRGTPEMLDRMCWFPAEGLQMPMDTNASP
ncbi:MAG: glycoside hydrolase family 25 protein [Bacteroidetes bacterium]|nr:MAG: glycoside hydrolase family 25 protein [Bacteroidota bacterium]